MSLSLVRGLLSVVQEGAENRWWGLACPSHCKGPGFGGLAAAFLLGVLLTLLSFIFWQGVRIVPREAVPAPQVTRQANRRLAAYAYGR